jgi:hypothetical protein
VEYSGTAQSISAENYGNLTLSGSGNKTLSNLSTSIANAFTNTGGTMVPGSGTVIFTGASGSIAGSSAKIFNNLEIDSGASISQASGTGNVTINGDYTNDGTFSQNTAITTTFGGITQSLSGAGSTTLGSITVQGTSTTNANSHDFSMAGTFTVSSGGTFNGGTATLTFTGSSVMGGGTGSYNFNSLKITGTLTNNTNNKSFNLTGDWTNNGTYTKGTETVTFNGSAATQTIGGSTATPFNSLTIANTSFSVAASTNFSASGTLTINANAVLTPAAAVVVSGAGNLTGSGTAQVTRTAATADFSSQYTITSKVLTNLTVQYIGTAAQTVSGGLAYSNLRDSNTSATVISGNNFSVSGTMTVDAGAVFSPVSTHVINSSAAAGTITGSGTIQVTRTTTTADYANQYKFLTNTLTSMTVDYAGASAQTVNSSVGPYGGLKSSGGGTKTLDGNVTVNSALTLTSGNINTSTNTLTLTSVATVSGGSTGSFVIGTLKKVAVPSSFTFPVGYNAANAYTPLDLANASGGGDLTVAPTHSSAPGVSAGSSLSEYWTLTLSGSLTTDLTFNYLEGDVQGTEANYRLIRVDSGTSVSFPNQCPTPSVDTACVDPTNNKATILAVNAFSNWTVGENLAPTAVRLTGFTATAQDDGVQLEWKSGFEANNLGYQLYRYQDGQRTKVTPSLIAGSSLIRKGGGELASGFSYGWFDNQGTVGTQYELQAIDLHGAVQTFAPLYKGQSGANVDSQKTRAVLLTELAGTSTDLPAQNGWAKGMTAASPRQTTQAGTQSLTTQQSIAAQPAVKIRVNQTGWYRITQPQLVANGLDLSADARKLQLYADGVEVPIRLSSDKPKLGPGDTLEFYGVGLDALTTDTHTYYLISGAHNGLRIAASPVANLKKNESLAPDFLYTVESKERLIYLPGLLNGENNNIFGQFLSSDPVTQNLTLQNIDAAANAGAQLEVVLQGFTEVDHQVQVELNGSYVGTVSFSGVTHKSSTLPINGALLREGVNAVTMTAAGGDVDFSLVDVLRMTYAHSYRADNDSLSFSVGTRSASVSGFTSASIRVIDVTNPGAVQELTPKINNTGGSYGFSIPTSGTVQNLIAFVDNLARQPVSMVKNQPSTWNAATNAADMVIVTHDNFRSSADSLAAARRAQGLRVSIVDVEDVYDEFSYGAHTPEALKDFLAWSNAHWTTAPRYVLLFGDSSWDPRNYLGQGFSDYVPTKLVDTAEFETASDDWLADFNNDGIPEIAVGRLPARTAGDASTMVSKILNYDQERAGGAPLRGALLVSDNGFENQTAQVQSYLSSITTVQTLNRSAIGNDDTLRTQIVSNIDQGPTIVNYFGHGSNGVWTSAGLLNEDNAGTLTNGNRTSLFVMMTCLNGYFHDAFIDSLAETVLKNPQGGAFAVWASSGATEPVGQALMNTQLYQSLLGSQPMTLGDAVRQAKMATSDFDVRRTWILFGDPAMKVK